MSDERPKLRVVGPEKEGPADRARRLEAEASSAAKDLAITWLASMEAQASLADSVAACTYISPGVRQAAEAQVRELSNMIPRVTAILGR